MPGIGINATNKSYPFLGLKEGNDFILPMDIKKAYREDNPKCEFCKCFLLVTGLDDEYVPICLASNSVIKKEQIACDFYSVK